MRWRTGRQSANVEDIRGAGLPGRLSGGLKLGGGTVLLLLLATVLLGGNPAVLLDVLDGGDPQSPPHAVNRPQNDEAKAFVSVVLADTEDTWGKLFAANGERYRPPKLVLYSDMVQSACGINGAATGPFYCPIDQKVYLDLSFLRELQKLGASGDFAVAYVIAHEIGHHVQTLLGTTQDVQRMQQQVSRSDANALSVSTELQADCLAGVWAHHAGRQQDLLEAGDIEEGLAAAAAVGDDRLQRRTGQQVNPDSFTHGSSQQRVQQFRTGLQAGDLAACNTLARSDEARATDR
jgi:uncharacterized protein